MNAINKDELIDDIMELNIDQTYKKIFVDVVQKAEVVGRILPKKQYVKFLPCVCGKNSRSCWYGHDGCQYECNGCGRRSPMAPSKEGAKIAWNDMIIPLIENLKED